MFCINTIEPLGHDASLSASASSSHVMSHGGFYSVCEHSKHRNAKLYNFGVTWDSSPPSLFMFIFMSDTASAASSGLLGRREGGLVVIRGPGVNNNKHTTTTTTTNNNNNKHIIIIYNH